MEPERRSSVSVTRSTSRPTLVALGVATVVAVLLSLAADAALVAIGTRVFPSTRTFHHFRFGDYGTLTVAGVVIACSAWFVITRVSSVPRSLYLRLAVVVTLALWLPDLWILARGEPPEAVSVLMLMHLAVAVVTYNVVVRVGAPRHEERSAQIGTAASSTTAAVSKSLLAERRTAWLAMVGLVSLETVLGVVCLVVVPFQRATSLVPHKGVVVYFVHSVVGAVMLGGGLALLVSSRAGTRPLRISSGIGFVGLVLGACGGALSVERGLRFGAVALMLAGALVAATGYLLPAIDPGASADPRRGG